MSKTALQHAESRILTELQRRLDEAATIENARAWAADSEQFLFCIDALEMSAHSYAADWAVNQLEDRFEDLLSQR